MMHEPAVRNWLACSLNVIAMLRLGQQAIDFEILHPAEVIRNKTDCVPKRATFCFARDLHALKHSSCVEIFEYSFRIRCPKALYQMGASADPRSLY